MFAFASGRYPGNPPLWGELYTVARAGGSGAWEMSRLPKGARPAESSGEHEYNALLVKHSMISRACKQVLLERDVFAWGTRPAIEPGTLPRLLASPLL